MDTIKPNVNPLSVIAILWCVVIPQCLLILLNVRGWTLVYGEANITEKNLALLLLFGELAIIALAIVAIGLVALKGIKLGWKTTLAALLVHGLYMCFVLASMERLIPSSIQPWILNEENVGRWNITLFMPGAFLSLYILTKIFFNGIGKTIKRSTILFSLIGMPVAWYLLVTLMQPLWFSQYMVVGFVIIGILMVVAFLVALIHVFDKLAHSSWFDSGNDNDFRQMIVVILLGIVAPLGGLALNRAIPFPADFQSIGVYAFTLLNGLILLIKPSKGKHSALVLFLRCFSFPFIFYFFLVFLPFLPLSLLAIVAIGAGFLMLTPLALGLYQTRISIDQYRLTRTEIGAQKTILIATLGFLILPSYFVLQANLDKHALNSSLDYFYAHKLTSNTPSRAQSQRAANTLIKLRNRKTGVQLPYLSGMYNAIVFGDMVLSDKKIQRMHRLLTGESMPKENTSFFGNTRSRNSWRGRGVAAPNQEVEISDLNLDKRSTGSATLKLTLLNQTENTHSLFTEKLTLSEGVFISGLRLKIKDKWEPARIFDRKTALWVFQKITEVRRDPALLYYLTPNTVELHVYPFPSKGIREVEIDFEYHPDIASKVNIGSQVIDLNSDVPNNSVLSSSGVRLIQNLENYSFERKPYLHYILDFSKNSTISTQEFVDRIQTASTQLGLNELKISAANIGVSQQLEPSLLSASNTQELSKAVNAIQLERVGGLWLEQSLSKEILNTADTLKESNFKRKPLFVLITDQIESNIEKPDLSHWRHLIPDVSHWFIYSRSELIEEKIIGAQKSPLVLALKDPAKISIRPINKSSIVDAKRDEDIEVFSPQNGVFTSIANNQDPTSTLEGWSHRALAWLQWREARLDLSAFEKQRTEFLTLSREANVLLPSTSFIVVESASQWEILKRKEEQSLNNHSGLDFEDEQQTPEPSWWLMLIGLLIFLYLKEARHRFKRVE